MRSMLFVPGDSRKKFDKARSGNADALILDLEDSVAQEAKIAARDVTCDMLREPRGSQALYVRINALDTGLSLGDLGAVMPLAPDGVVLPKCESPDDVRQLSHWLDAFETAAGLPAGQTRIVIVATETAPAVFSLGNYKNCSPRLEAMMWGAEDLAAALGATANRDDGIYGEPFRLARNLCLVGAAAAGVGAIDTVHVDLDDLESLKRDAVQARRDGFTAKAVVHPKHVDVVNAAFSPSDAEIDWARRVLAVLQADGGKGTVKLDGKMIDKPHERLANRLLAMRR